MKGEMLTTEQVFALMRGDIDAAQMPPQGIRNQMKRQATERFEDNEFADWDSGNETQSDDGTIPIEEIPSNAPAKRAPINISDMTRATTQNVVEEEGNLSWKDWDEA